MGFIFFFPAVDVLCETDLALLTACSELTMSVARGEKSVKIPSPEEQFLYWGKRAAPLRVAAAEEITAHSYSLVRDEYDDLLSVLLGPDALLGCEPLLEYLDGPPHLLRARPSLHEDQVAPFDHQVPVETPQAGDVGMNVVDQTNGEDGV